MQGPIIISIVQWAQSFQVYSPQSFLRALSQTIFFVISPALTMIMVNQIKFTNVTCTFYRSFKFFEQIYPGLFFSFTFIQRISLPYFTWHLLIFESEEGLKATWSSTTVPTRPLSHDRFYIKKIKIIKINFKKVNTQSPLNRSLMTGFILEKIKIKPLSQDRFQIKKNK